MCVENAHLWADDDKELSLHFWGVIFISFGFDFYSAI